LIIDRTLLAGNENLFYVRFYTDQNIISETYLATYFIIPGEETLISTVPDSMLRITEFGSIQNILFAQLFQLILPVYMKINDFPPIDYILC